MNAMDVVETALVAPVGLHWLRLFRAIRNAKSPVFTHV
jgi:hypothetical protein